MYIKQVVIRGFKTYRDQTGLDEDFSPGANVVVGFNGSGKSNFFQAILFVLSDQFTSLRADTRRALLHEGAGQPVLTAFVEVILDNTDRRIPIENDQVSIKRLFGVKKDDWLLDGKHSSKGEIFGLLEGAGFAKTSPYYIVQQGKVSELTLMSDVQRLGLLKDISGAGVYDDRRQESKKIMEDTLMRRIRTDELIEEIERRLSSLEEEQRELRECERLESRKRTLEYVLADREWRSLQDRIDEVQTRRNSASAQLVVLQGQWGSVRMRIADAEGDLHKQEDERKLVEEQIASLLGERSQKIDAVLQARLKADEEARKHLEVEGSTAGRLDELQRARAELATAVSEIDAARPEVEIAERRFQGIAQRCHVATTEREQLLAKQGRRQQYGSVEERNSALREEIHRKTNQLKQGRRAQDECDGKLEKAEERSKKALQEVTEHRDLLTTSEAQLGDLGRSMRELGEQLDGNSERLRLLHQEQSRAKQDYEVLRREAQTSQQRLEGSMPRASRIGVGAVVRWAEEHGLSGSIRGPLLSHIEVSSTFRVAVESFASSALFNVLAINDDVAAQAVKYVRTKRLGSVVVTPLSQLSFKEPRFPQMEGVKPLVDVIRCADWVRPAVLQIFGRGVVCRSMELCEELALSHNADAITLDGDRFSRKGVVTGGYQDPQRFVRLSLAESLRTVHAKIRDSEQRLPKIEAQICEVSQKMDSLHEERRKVQEQREGIRALMVKSGEAIQSFESVVSKNSREVAELREWRHRMEVLIAECEVSIEAKRSELQTKTLSGLSVTDETCLQNLTREVEELTKEQSSAQEAHRRARSLLGEKEAKIEGCLRVRIHELEKEVMQCSKHVALEKAGEALQERARLEREQSEVDERADLARKKLEVLSQSCDEGKRNLSELVAEEQRLQEEAAEISVRVDSLSLESKTQAEKKAEVDARLRSLTAPAADVDQCQQLPKPQLVQELAQSNRELQAFERVNRKAVEQYENFSDQLVDLRKRKQDIDEAEGSLIAALQSIDEQKETTMLQALRKVNEHFQHVFAEIVPGGVGKLRVIYSSEHCTQSASMSSQGTSVGELVGVRIDVSFTGQAQTFLSMNQLSGGQKTVVALSLIFAIQRLEPAPFYLLDEVDAALDASYRTSLANLVERIARSSQVIMTTFRLEAIDKADRCYRVFQQNRASRIESIACEQAKQVLREQDRLQAPSV